MDDLGGKPLFLETSFIVPLGLFVKVKDVHLSSVSWCFAEGFSGLERHLPPPTGEFGSLTLAGGASNGNGLG